MNNNDFDYIKNKFDNAELAVPQELDDKVLSALDKADAPKRIPFVKTRGFKAGVSLVACLAVFVASFAGFKLSQPVKLAQDAVSTDNGLPTFSNQQELDDYFEEISKEYKRTYFYKGSGMKDGLTVDESAKAESSADINGTAFDSDIENSFAKTYLQEQGVDEADTIKTNGKYIFKLGDYSDYDYSSSYITIFEAEGGKTKKLNRIEFKNRYDSQAEYIDQQINDFYLKDDRLIVELYSFYYVGEKAKSETECIVYDVSNPNAPNKLYSYSQAGYYASSRMIGDTLYLVSSYSNYYYAGDRIKAKDYVPYYSENDEKACPLEPSDIAYSCRKGNSFTVASAIDTKACKLIDKTKSIIGNSSDVYCTTDSLYVIGWDYDKNGREKTAVSKISFDNGLEFVASCKFNGHFDSQYSFGERDGVLYACVTSYNPKTEKEANYIYSFDEHLNKLGRTKAFGVDESVRAVKYIGDYAYVITYEEIDPLFAIDISDPKDMQIKGSVKITGFSTMLVPIGDDKLIGIGNATKDSDIEDVDMEAVAGIKLALFDVSNPKEPKVLDSKEFLERSSEAQYNPKALIINDDKGYMAIPYEDDSYSSAGAIIFSVKDDKIVLDNGFKYDVSNDSFSSTRLTYIDDYIYSLDSAEHVVSHQVK